MDQFYIFIYCMKSIKKNNKKPISKSKFIKKNGYYTIKKRNHKKRLSRKLWHGGDPSKLIQAIRDQNISEIKNILDKDTTLLNQPIATETMGFTPLHYAVYETNDVVKALLHYVQSYKAVNIVNKRGFTPLHLAIINGSDINIIQTLIDNGADFKKIMVDKTPLIYCIENSKFEIVKIFISKIIDNYKLSVFSLENYNVIENIKIDSDNKEYDIPILSYFIDTKNCDMVRFIIEKVIGGVPKKVYYANILHNVTQRGQLMRSKSSQEIPPVHFQPQYITNLTYSLQSQTKNTIDKNIRNECLKSLQKIIKNNKNDDMAKCMIESVTNIDKNIVDKIDKELIQNFLESILSKYTINRNDNMVKFIINIILDYKIDIKTIKIQYPYDTVGDYIKAYEDTLPILILYINYLLYYRNQMGENNVIKEDYDMVNFIIDTMVKHKVDINEYYIYDYISQYKPFEKNTLLSWFIKAYIRESNRNTDIEETGTQKVLYEITIKLIDLGVDVNRRAFSNGFTPFCHCIYNDLEFIQQTTIDRIINIIINLINHKAETNFMLDDETPLGFMIRREKPIDIIMKLIELNVIITTDENTIIITIEKIIDKRSKLFNKIDILDSLLNHGVIVLAETMNKIMNVLNKYIDLSKFSNDNKDNTIFYSNMDIIETLLVHSTKMSYTYESIKTFMNNQILSYCITTNKIRIFTIYVNGIDKQDINKRMMNDNDAYISANISGNISESEKKYTILIYCIKQNNIKLVKILIDAGADVNQRDVNGDTPLQHCIKQNNKDLIDLLNNSGAHDNDGNTNGKPLHKFTNSNGSGYGSGYESDDNGSGYGSGYESDENGSGYESDENGSVYESDDNGSGYGSGAEYDNGSGDEYDSPPTIKLVVVFNGKSNEIYVASNEIILSVKKKIRNILNVQIAAVLTLKYQTKILKDNLTLKDYNIVNNDKIEVLYQ